MEADEKNLSLLKQLDLKNCDVLKNTKKNLKGKLKFNTFIENMNNILKSIDKEQLKSKNKYDLQLVQFACQAVEDVFTEKNSGDIKLSAVIEVLKSFYDDNEDLIKTFVEISLKKIHHSTIYRRNKNKINNFFFWVWSLVAKR